MAKRWTIEEDRIIVQEQDKDFNGISEALAKKGYIRSARAVRERVRVMFWAAVGLNAVHTLDEFWAQKRKWAHHR